MRWKIWYLIFLASDCFSESVSLGAKPPVLSVGGIGVSLERSGWNSLLKQAISVEINSAKRTHLSKSQIVKKQKTEGSKPPP